MSFQQVLEFLHIYRSCAGGWQGLLDFSPPILGFAELAQVKSSSRALICFQPTLCTTVGHTGLALLSACKSVTISRVRFRCSHMSASSTTWFCKSIVYLACLSLEDYVYEWAIGSEASFKGTRGITSSSIHLDQSRVADCSSKGPPRSTVLRSSRSHSNPGNLLASVKCYGHEIQKDNLWVFPRKLEDLFKTSNDNTCAQLPPWNVL
jgi:hypothetical protein